MLQYNRYTYFNVEIRPPLIFDHNFHIIDHFLLVCFTLRTYMTPQNAHKYISYFMKLDNHVQYVHTFYISKWECMIINGNV